MFRPASVLFGFIFLVVVGFPGVTFGQNKALPASLTQDQWAGAKQSINLPTGITMKYIEMGQADGPPLIFLHGMTDNSRSWSLLVPYFTDKYHVYMLDQRGHGDTDKPDLRMFSLAMYAADLAAFMEAKNIDKAHIVGHSLGGMIAQAFAMNYPEKTMRLAMIGTAVPGRGSHELMYGLYGAVAAFGDNRPDDEFMAAWYSNPNPVDEDFLKREMAESKNITPSAWRAIAKGAAVADLSSFMEEIKAPTLIMWGSADAFMSSELQDALRKAIPRAEFIAYDKHGHNLQWEIPETMARDLLKFLE